MEMAERWKAWKTKIRFPKLPTAPWKSRKSGEIPTFPQPRQPAAQGITHSSEPTPTELKGQLSTVGGRPRFQYHLALE